RERSRATNFLGRDARHAGTVPSEDAVVSTNPEHVSLVWNEAIDLIHRNFRDQAGMPGLHADKPGIARPQPNNPIGGLCDRGDEGPWERCPREHRLEVVRTPHEQALAPVCYKNRSVVPRCHRANLRLGRPWNVQNTLEYAVAKAHQRGAPKPR